MNDWTAWGNGHNQPGPPPKTHNKAGMDNSGCVRVAVVPVLLLLAVLVVFLNA